MTSPDYRLASEPCRVAHACIMWQRLDAYLTEHASTLTEAEHAAVSEQLDALYSLMTKRRTK